jgi:NhaP-type Na+/H+ or K+/H+ antiporter
MNMGRVIAVFGGVVGVLIIALILLIPRIPPGADLALELWKALLTLIVAILTTGFLSFLLAQYNAAQARRDEYARVLTGALQQLKSGYERVQVARFFIAAHRTGKTLSEQIPAISEARSWLHKVQRERFIIGTTIDEDVQSMLDYLTAITNEYKGNYLKVLEARLLEERAQKKLLDEGASDLSAITELPVEHFPILAGMVDDKAWTKDAFQKSYSSAKHSLQVLLDEASDSARMRHP